MEVLYEKSLGRTEFHRRNAPAGGLCGQIRQTFNGQAQIKTDTELSQSITRDPEVRELTSGIRSGA